MENASKALIIAGAILLSILLISLGIYIFQQANGVISGSGMTKAEISAFNQQFTKYEGDKKAGSEIRALVQEVLANNKGEDASDETQIEIIDGKNAVALKTTDTKPTYNTNFKNTKYYKVEVTDYQTSGRVKSITVTEN